MKVVCGNKDSREEVQALKDFYEFLLDPFRFEKDPFKADIFRPELLKKAIDQLPLNERLSVYGQILGYNYKSHDLFTKSVRKLRSINLRVVYDYSLILEVERAKDHQNYDPCVVLAYARLYDDFRSKNSSRTFDIGLLSGIVNMARSKKVLDLNYGLTDGKSHNLRDVALKLHMSVAECKELKDDSLQILQHLYCY